MQMETSVIESPSNSTATLAPQPAPETQGTQPKGPTTKPPDGRSNRNLSPIDQAIERAKANRVNKGNEATGEAKTQEQASQSTELEANAETKTEGNPSTDGDYLEAVRIGDQDVPVPDLFNRFEFDVFANGDYKHVDGQKLLDMASIGFAATKRVETAKEAIRQSDAIVQEVKTQYEQKLSQEVNKGVADYLNDLMEKAKSGINPGTGKPFATAGERTGAVALAQKLVDLNASEGKSGNTLTLENIEKLVEAKLNEKTGQTEKQKAETQRQNLLAQISNVAESSLQKATEPLMQFFTGDDGKTVDQEQFEDFKDIIRKKADKLWEEAGRPLDPKKSSEFVTKAAQATMDKWKSRFKTTEVKPKQPPVGGTGSGLPASIAPKKTFSNPKDALDAKLKELMQSRKKA
jgi:hypothetical protein